LIQNNTVPADKIVAGFSGAQNHSAPATALVEKRPEKRSQNPEKSPVHAEYRIRDDPVGIIPPENIRFIMATRGDTHSF
jgi:hypothetical protein